MSSGSDTGRSTRYEGFSDYNVVSRNVANAVDDAVDAYAIVQSKHTVHSKLEPELAAKACSNILGAAIRLLPELEEDLDDVDEYQEMINKWSGDGGYIDQLEETNLAYTCPEWLGVFVIDIRRAAWQLGYLQAGRTVRQEPDDPVEADTEAMFNNL